MKAYRFRLATVARIRALEQRVARDRFTLAQRDLRRMRETEHIAQGALRALRSPHGLTTMSALAWVNDQGERLAEALQVCRQAVAEAESKCAEARRECTEATKRSEVLERLHAQGLEHWQVETAREEAAELDDLSHSRRRTAGVGR